VGALNNAEVGKYCNEYFVSTYQKVATFTIVNGQKQGGNVAAYFCAPDGRVLHCVAGPVDAQTFLREAKWVVETTKICMKDSTGKDGKMDGAKFKELFRKAHIPAPAGVKVGREALRKVTRQSNAELRPLAEAYHQTRCREKPPTVPPANKTATQQPTSASIIVLLMITAMMTVLLIAT
jgi:hypothetical protein